MASMGTLPGARRHHRGRPVLGVRPRRRGLVTGCGAAALLVGLGWLALLTGATSLGAGDVVAALAGGDGASILWRVRMPRLVAAVVIGAALGLSGAVFQSISRNPLGSPDLVGFVTGAATGAVVAVTVLGARPWAVSAFAIGGGLGTAVVVLGLSRRSDATAGYRLILVGIGAGAFLQAVNSLLLTRVDGETASTAQLWLVGSLTAIGWQDAVIAVVGLLALAPVIVVLARHLTVAELGDDFATQVGSRVSATRLGATMCATGLAAAATAAAGPIAFVALAAPHLMRRIARAPSTPFALSALGGAVLMLSADLAAQRLPLGLRMPVALMTGVLGGGYLLWLLARSRW